MASLIFLIIDVEILVILPYISSYFVTLELYIRPQLLILGTTALFKIIITKIIIIMTILIIKITKMIMISTAILQNITEKLEKMTCFVSTISKVLLYATHW